MYPCNQEPSQNVELVEMGPVDIRQKINKKTQTKMTKKEKIKATLTANWLKIGIISFLLFASSSYDLTSDGLLSYTFLNGTYYVKKFPNRPDSKFKSQLSFKVCNNKAYRIVANTD